MRGKTTKAIIVIFVVAIFLAALGNVLNENVKEVKASGSEVMSLPGGTWIHDHIDDETIVKRVDVNPSITGDQQIIELNPGDTITIEVTIQIWSSGGPSIIKQAFATYSWNSAWPPSDYYQLYNGGTGYYPGITFTKTFTVQAPLTEGDYSVWFCSDAQYNMQDAINNLDSPPSCLPHAIIKVRSNGDYIIPWQVELPKVSDFNCYRADAGDIDGDGKDEVALIPDDNNYGGPGDVDNISVFDDDSSLMWSKSILKEQCSIAVKDVDNDGRAEVFVGGTNKDWSNSDGHIWAFEENGSLIWHFVDTVDSAFWSLIPGDFVFKNIDNDSNLETIVSNTGFLATDTYAIDSNGSQIWRIHGNEANDVALGDLNNDGNDEIILMTNVGKMIYVIEPASGTILWSKQLVNYNRGTVGDLNGDGIDDLLIISKGQELYTPDKMYAIKNDGTILWSKDINDDYCQNPILKDIDGDGKEDIILSEGNRIFALKNDGTAVLWNHTLPYTVGNLFGFDLNGDGLYETIFFVNKSMYKVSNDGDISKVLDLNVSDNWRPMISWRGRVSVEKSRYAAYLTSADTNGNGIAEFLIEEIFSDHVRISAVEPTIQNPNIVYVDDDFNSSTPGWQYDHFNKIQDGIDAVAENGTVYVFNGTYYENIDITKDGLHLIGENKNTTIIDGSTATNNGITIKNHDNVTVSGFTGCGTELNLTQV